MIILGLTLDFHKNYLMKSKKNLLKRKVDKHSGILDYLCTKEKYLEANDYATSEGDSNSNDEIDIYPITIKVKAEAFAKQHLITDKNR